MADNIEYWLRGPVSGVPSLLQPVAHALLQARDEINTALNEFPDQLLWERPAAVASPGFHLQHLRGVLDRLFTYAAGEQLSLEQLQALKMEGKLYEGNASTRELLDLLNNQIELSIETLKKIDENQLTERREVGRAKIPSTLIGLLFHSAEHTMRHTGQLLVTIRMITENRTN